MEQNTEMCEVCQKPVEECICCPEWSHVCSLDLGEHYCPVCFPEKKKAVADGRDSRPDEHFMRFAIKEAENAFAENEVPVGAVLVKGDEIIASARNRRESLHDPTAHAELIVIREGAMKTGNWRLTDAILYVTKEPCVMCAGAMVNARLGRLVYGCRDERYGAVTSRYQLVYDPSLNHRVKVVSGILDDECADILKRFFVQLRTAD